MKSLVFTVKLCLVGLSDFIMALSGNYDERIPMTVYTVDIRPPLRILQIPSEKRIRFGNTVGEELGFSSYRGLLLHKPICIRYDMTIQQVADALCDSFNVTHVRYLEGVITRKHFERIFPPFSFFNHYK